MKAYKLRRRKDGLFFGGKESRAVDRHDHTGRFYMTESSAVGAIEMSGRILRDYDLVVFELIESDVIDYSEVLSE